MACPPDLHQLDEEVFLQDTYDPVTIRAQFLVEYRIRFPLRELAGEDLRVGWKTFNRISSVHKTIRMRKLGTFENRKMNYVVIVVHK